jgi:hypothetical protein
MKLKLAGLVSEGSGKVNEDAVGFLGDENDIRAAWALDGVTGINDSGLGVPGSDAQWFVTRIDAHLRDLLARPRELIDTLAQLIDRLIEDMAKHILPDNYDPPAACLAAICRTGNEWQAVRLGDCRLLAEDRTGFRRIVDFSNDEFDHWITAEATRLRQSGMTDLDDLFRALQPAHFNSRRQRNRPGGYGVIEADRACLAFAEYLRLDDPSAVLLASDGFFRLVDHYGETSESSLLTRAKQNGGVTSLYERLRHIERDDPDCLAFPRLKPQDDASAIALIEA